MIPKNCEWIEGWAGFKGGLVVPKVDYISNKYLDVKYGDDALQSLDIYLPDGERIKRPVFVLIHGGGFTHCDKRDFHLYPGIYALERGYALVSLNYRLAPKNPFPDGINDVKKAILWICENAEEYGFDCDRIFLFGPSAGGSFSTLASMQSRDFLGGKGRVRAAAALCPAVDLINIRNDYKTNPNKPPFLGLLIKQLYRQYFGAERDNIEILKAASYMPYVSENIPPLYIQMGDMDPLIPLNEIKEMYEKVKEAIGEENVVLDIMPGAAHSGGDENYFLRKNIENILDFFAKYTA